MELVEGRGQTRVRLRRVVLATLAAIITVNLWTGFPLAAVWVGSHVQADQGITMTAMFVVVAMLAVLELLGLMALSRVGAAYDATIERAPAARRPAPWLRSVRGERDEDIERKQTLTAVERIAVVSVVLCVVAFEAWFFFFAGSPI